MPAGQWQVLNPPVDWAAARLLPMAKVYSQEWAIARHIQGAEFGLLPSIDRAAEHILLFLPKAKPRLQQLLWLIANDMPANATLWVVGENSGGIKSAPKQLAPHFSTVEKLANAKRCGLLRCQQPLASEAVSDEPDWFDFQDWKLCGLPGLFNKGQVDKGTQLLLQHLPKMFGRALDVGCGGGILSLAALQKGAESVVAVDSSAIAVAATQQTMLKNNISAVQVLASDVLSEVPRDIGGSFEWIISNPPFHSGVATDYEPARQLVKDARRYLKSGGRLMLVANRHLPYEQWLESSFKRWEVLAQENGFKILVAYQ